MVDILEYNEARWPTRTLQQEEEQDAQLTAAAALEPPRFQWEAGAVDECGKPCELLVVACTPASSCLMQHAASLSKVATISMLPVLTRPPPEDEGPPTHHVVASLYVAAGSPRVAVCCIDGSPAAVKQEQAGSLARALLQEAPCQQLLVFGSLLAEQYRGPEDAAEQFLGFLLQTSTAAAAAATACSSSSAAVLPFLPPGSIVSGLPAALMTQAQLHDLPALLVVAVDKVPRLVPSTIPDLAAAALRSLQQLNPVAAKVLAAGLGDRSAHTAAEAACRKLVVPPAIYV